MNSKPKHYKLDLQIYNTLKYKYVISAPSLWVTSMWIVTGIVVGLASFKRPP